MANSLDTSGDVVELSSTDGVAFIEQASLLTRLHYFDGQFLRAASLTAEQDYHRHAVQLANLAGGWGVVNGLGIALAGEQLRVGAGLAITPSGHFVLAGMDMQAKLADLLGSAKPTPAPGAAEFGDCLQDKPTATASTGLQVYEITVGPVEGLCGNEAVFGKLCETACATDSRRPFWREGVVLRLRPRTLALPGSSAVPVTAVHLRNRVASAYFALEPGLPASHVSASGLAGDVWCGGAALYGRDEVVIGLLVREGGSTRVLDAWSGRRERMDAQARSYWQGRMAMRPWNVFLAHILQFQCQLSGALEPGGGGFAPVDDCDRIRVLLDRTRRELEALTSRWRQTGKQLLLKTGDLSKQQMTEVGTHVSSTYAEIGQLSQELAVVEAGAGALPVQRMLIQAGFLDLPPAGYLPVAPGKVALEVQLQRMFGEGVKLHLHAVAEDEIAHLLEEAQHMRRISLTRGIDDPKLIEPVEVFVPDGRLVDAKAPATGEWWQVVVQPEWANPAQAVKVGRASAPVMMAPQDATAAAAPSAASKGAADAAAKPASKSAAKAGTKAGAQAKAETGADTKAPKLGIDLGSVLDGEVQLRIPGLARTHLLDDGHPAISLVLAHDPGDAGSTGVGRLVEKKSAEGFDDGDTGDITSAAWLAADIGTDPFDLPVGGDTAARAEVRAGFATLVATLGASATITLLARESTARGGLRLRLQADAVMHTKLVSTVGAGSGDNSDSGSLRLTLERDGDGRSGRLVIDEDPMNLADGAGVLRWRETPREAVLQLVFQVARKIVDGGIRMMRAAAEAAAEAGDAVGVASVIDDRLIDAAVKDPAANLLTLRLARAYGLPGMPAPASATGAAALNALAFIADASDDAAFLARARRRLFPTLDQPALQTVRASLDWVLFRRARTHLCAPACSPPAALALEAVQVWHLQVQDKKTLEVLKKALDQGDGQTLAAFKFKRVGILRYRDESTRPEEPVATVLSMWTAAQPAAMVVLGRAWETAPATGQGWQNHFRLREMLGLIKTLTQPPPRGDGSLAAIRSPGTPLDDGALDGGMLVVTMPGSVSVHPHRTVFMSFGLYADVLPALRKDPASGMKQLDEIAKDAATGVLDLDAHFSGDALVAADAAALSEADTTLREAANRNVNVRVHIFRVDATPMPSTVHPDAEQQAIATLLKVDLTPPPNGSNDGSVTAPLADLGRGAHVLTLLGYEDIS